MRPSDVPALAATPPITELSTPATVRARRPRLPFATFGELPRGQSRDPHDVAAKDADEQQRIADRVEGILP